MIVGISGKKHSGKSTVGNYLHARMQGSMLLPFAFKVKEISRDLFGASLAHTDGSEQDKNRITACGKWTGRQVMQLVGESMRSIWTDCWIHAWESEVVAAWAEHGAIPIIVPDVRHENEVDKIHEMGGIVIRLLRAPYADLHVSEVALDSYQGFDLEIDNDGQSAEETCFEAFAFCRERGVL
jgi:hypothetical protein